MSEKLLFANSDVTVHKLRGVATTQFGDKTEDVESVVLRQGDTFPLDGLASYQKKAAEKGELYGVDVVSEDEATKRREEISKLRAVTLGAGVPNAFQSLSLSGPDAQDGSFSDHLLSDAERVANHAARGEIESGEDGTDGEVTVAGAESENSPAQSGRKTRKSEEVQGSGGQESSDKE